MKKNNFHHLGLLLVILILTSLACGVGDTGIVEPEAAVTAETAVEAVPPSDAVEEPVTEPENAPEQAEQISDYLELPLEIRQTEYVMLEKRLVEMMAKEEKS